MYKGFDLSGKVAALTGSTAGMGLAIARGLAECGASIVVSSHLREDTDRTAEVLAGEGFAVKGVKCDITDRADVTSFGERATAAFGKVDILFCVAGNQAPLGSLYDLTSEALTELLTTTVVNNHTIARQFLPEMAKRRDGSIVVMSSISSVRANPMIAGYGAAKAALNSLVRNIATEWGEFNIRANALAPSIVRTNFSESVWGDSERREFILRKIPAKRFADPEDVVGAAILLASPAGSYISGQVILLDGARSIT
jgi:NAD(P)-dependent dehydrogenase (short-subunit alcohol dehydrogenase family)